MGNNGSKLRHEKPRPPSKLVHTVEALPGEAVHREIRRVEQENVGVESAHKGEETAEVLLHTAHRKLQQHRATVRAERTASTTAQTAPVYGGQAPTGSHRGKPSQVGGQENGGRRQKGSALGVCQPKDLPHFPGHCRHGGHLVQHLCLLRRSHAGRSVRPGDSGLCQ